jgi:hypothetical protein
MALPDFIPTWATLVGGNVATGLVPTSALLTGTLTENQVTYGLVTYSFSGSPNLSSVLYGQALTVTGFTQPANNGVSMFIQAADNTAKTITVKVTDRTTALLDESGVVSAAAVATTTGAARKEMSDAKQAFGWTPGEKPGAGHLNWWMHGVGQMLEHYAAAVPEGYDQLQAKLTEGANISIVDNGDGTQRISASLIVTQVPSIGDTFTQNSHGFLAKDVVRHNGSVWVKAQASTLAGCTDAWLVVSTTTNTFIAVKQGRYTVTGHGLTAGTLYYLSSGTAGLLTSTKPVGTNSLPLGFFLPVVFVESSNVLHILGNSYPSFDPLLAKHTFVSAGSSVTFSGLDGDTHGFYRAEIQGANPSTAQELWAGVNGDNGSGSSSRRELWTATSTSDSANNADRAVIGQTVSGGAFDVTLKLSRMGTIWLMKSDCAAVGATNTQERIDRSTISRFSASNITSLTFDGNSSNLYGAGTIIRLYRGEN